MGVRRQFLGLGSEAPVLMGVRAVFMERASFYWRRHVFMGIRPVFMG